MSNQSSKFRYRVKDLKTIFIVLVILLSLNLPGIRKYPLVICVSILCVFLSCFEHKIERYKFRLFLPAAFFLVAGSIVAIFHGNLSFYSFKTAALYITPIICVVCIESVYKAKDVRVMNGIFASLLIMMGITGAKSLIETGIYESAYAYIFSFFIIYYLDRKKYSMVVLSGVLSIIGNKRAALLATVVSIAAYYICKRKKKKNIERWTVIIFWGFVIAIYFWIYFIHSGFMYKLYTYGIHPMGRDSIYNRFSQYYKMSPLFLGKGIGFVLNVLYTNRLPDQDLLHCDWLHIYIEIGFWGLLIYFALFYRIIIRTNHKIRPVILALYINLFVAEVFGNLSVMIYEQFVFYYILLAVFEKDCRENYKIVELMG